MNPLIQPVMNKLKSWASFGENDSQESPYAAFKRKAAMTFDEKFPKVADPLKYNDQQKLDLGSRLGFATVGKNEIDLALSRTPATIEFTAVSEFVSSAIRCWREQNPTESDSLAARELLKGSASLAVIDGKIQAAKLAEEQAEAEHQAFERAYLEFRSIPGKHKAHSDKIASLEFERNRLTSTNFEAKIRQLIDFELNPRPGLVVAESIPSLLLQRDTLKLRVEVIADVLGQCRVALEKLADDNKRLAKELDLPEHRL
jgi:hypothetical protein